MILGVIIKMEKTKEKPQIPITRRTYEKILAYAKLMGNLECYGFLLSPRDNTDNIVQNAILAPSQRVSGGGAGIDDLAATESKAEIENSGYKALGFWHSHAGFSSFHSGIDDRNLEELLFDFAGNSERIIEREKKKEEYFYSRTKEGIILPLGNSGQEIKVSLNGPYSQTRQFTFRLGKSKSSISAHYDFEKKCLVLVNKDYTLAIKNLNGLPVITNVEPEKEKVGGEGVAYSIVVNPRGDCYAEMAKVRWCYLCANTEIRIIKDIGLKVLEVPQDIQFTKQELEAEIRKKVRRRGIW